MPAFLLLVATKYAEIHRQALLSPPALLLYTTTYFVHTTKYKYTDTDSIPEISFIPVSLQLPSQMPLNLPSCQSPRAPFPYESPVNR